MADETMPADALILAEISALDVQDVEEATAAEPLTIDLSPPEDVPAPGLTISDALSPGSLDDTTELERLTLDLDMSELMADWSSTILDDVQPDDLPGDVPAEMSPPQHQAGDEEELLLDLDDVEFDDDTPA